MVLSAGGRLPYVSLPRGDATGEQSLRPDDKLGRLYFFPHSATCPGCRRYLDGLRDASLVFAGWDGHAVAVMPRGEVAARLEGVTVLVDERGDVARRCGLMPGQAALMVVDRFGDIYHVADAGSSHALPDVRELESWLRFLATQCPE